MSDANNDEQELEILFEKLRELEKAMDSVSKSAERIETDIAFLQIMTNSFDPADFEANE
jgi:hypothetical protein